MREIPEVINWRRIDDRVTTSGQPTEAQLVEIKDLGVTHIINLGPHSNDGALEDETTSVQSLGMEYIYIPVDFENPTEENYSQFCSAMDRIQDTTVHVHCIYNARVSAFFYRYANEGHGDQAEAFARMDGIWRPGGNWATFIGNEADIDKPNRYSGYEY